MPITTMHPEDIRTHPLNVRRAVAVADLVESVRAQGVLQPLVLAPWPHDGADHDLTIPQREDGTTPKKGTIDWPLVLIAGHRRLAAAREAGLDEVPVVVHDHLTHLADQLGVMLSENGQRTDLTPVEEADGVQALLDLGIKAGDAAKRIGRSIAWVRDRRKLAAAPEWARARVMDGQLTLEDSAAIAAYTGDAAKRLEAAAERSPWDLRAAIKREEQLTGARARTDELAQQAGKNGTPIRGEDASHRTLGALAETIAVVDGDLTNEQIEELSHEAFDAVVAELHRTTCDGHVLVLREEAEQEMYPGFTRVVPAAAWWACENPARHTDDDDPTDDDEPTGEAQETDEERAAREEAKALDLALDEALAAAAEARTEHLAEALRARLGKAPRNPDPVEVALREWLIEELDDPLGYGREFEVALTGLLATDQDGIRERLDRCSTDGLTLAFWATRYISPLARSAQINTRNAWVNPHLRGHAATLEWAALVESLGWHWTDAEHECLDEVRDAEAARLAEAEAAEGGDDE